MKKDLTTILANTKQVNDCLEWTKCLNSDGYARANFSGNTNGKVHRVVYELCNGKLNGKEVVRHLCDNPVCINPMHLIKGSIADNVADMDLRQRRYRKIDKHIVQGVLNMLDDGLLQGEIAEFLGIDARRVSDIKCGRYDSNGRLTKKEN